jgi:hypothetical protein
MGAMKCLCRIVGVGYLSPMRLLFLVSLLFGCCGINLLAQELDYPPNSGSIPGVFDAGSHLGHCVDVHQAFGADNTGATDATAAIQNAIFYMYIQNGGGVPRQETLYFPAGIYRISNNIDATWWENTTGNTVTGTTTITGLATTANVRGGNNIVCSDFPAGTTIASVDSATQVTVKLPTHTPPYTGALGTHTGIAVQFNSPVYRLHFVGQAESGANATTILLDNAATPGTPVTGFTNAAAPKSMISTESDLDNGTDGFDNGVWNMTIDAGYNNSGAVALDFLGNNCASVRNVTIKSEAGTPHVGLALTRAYPGPLMVENVEVDGFATGVAVGHAEYSATFDKLTLKNQTSVG